MISLGDRPGCGPPGAGPRGAGPPGPNSDASHCGTNASQKSSTSQKTSTIRSIIIALYVGFAGRSIISDLWQGGGQPVHRLGIEAWRRDCGPAPHTLLIRLDGILGRIAPDPAYKVDEQQILPSTSCKHLRVHGNGHYRLAWHRHCHAEARCRAELEEGVPGERWILTSLWKTAWPNSSSRPSGFERPMKHRISVTNEGKLVVKINLRRAWTRILERFRKIQRSHGTPSQIQST